MRYDDQQERSDTQRIVAIFATRGFILDPMRAYAAWRQYSESMAAGWLFLPDDDSEVFQQVSYILPQLEM